MIPAPHPEGVINKFIEERREGIQHIAHQVDNIEKALEDVKTKEIVFIDEMSTLITRWIHM